MEDHSRLRARRLGWMRRIIMMPSERLLKKLAKAISVVGKEEGVQGRDVKLMLRMKLTKWALAMEGSR